MKKGLDPEMHTVTAVWPCGNTFETRSATPKLRLEICGECHPFFTGEQKMVDIGGSRGALLAPVPSQSAVRLLSP